MAAHWKAAELGSATGAGQRPLMPAAQYGLCGREPRRDGERECDVCALRRPGSWPCAISEAALLMRMLRSSSGGGHGSLPLHYQTACRRLFERQAGGSRCPILSLDVPTFRSGFRFCRRKKFFFGSELCFVRSGTLSASLRFSYRDLGISCSDLNIVFADHEFCYQIMVKRCSVAARCRGRSESFPRGICSS